MSRHRAPTSDDVGAKTRRMEPGLLRRAIPAPPPAADPEVSDLEVTELAEPTRIRTPWWVWASFAVVPLLGVLIAVLLAR